MREMPDAVCLDSEDDEEQQLSDGVADIDMIPSQTSTFSSYVRQAEQTLTHLHSPANATSSSDVLGQIVRAQHDLCAAAPLQAQTVDAPMPFSISPPAGGAVKRRCTDSPLKAASSLSDRPRRSTTGHQEPQPANLSTFQAGETGRIQPRDCAERSFGTECDFEHHEPTMFITTGSTVPYDESTQERMVEGVVLNGNGPDNALHSTMEPAVAGECKSSSFPWSTSVEAGQSPSTKQPECQWDSSKTPATRVDTGQESEHSFHGAEVTLRNGAYGQIGENRPDEQHENVQVDGAEAERSSRLPSVAPRSSPFVEILRHNAFPAAPHTMSESAQDDPVYERSPDRKRKSEFTGEVDDETDRTLSSDDRVIGLPKEMYKPRPSRRRATELWEPLDYSVVPEKAAKKRRKTAECNAPSVETKTTSFSHPNGISYEVARKSAERSLDPRTGMQNFGAEDDSIAVDNIQRSTPGRPSIEPLSPQAQRTQPTSQSSPDKQYNVLLEAHGESGSKVPTMGPPSLPASSSSRRAARSKTTIFEDHVSFDRSPRSPSLSQQQALRKSALGEVRSEAKQARIHKRRTIVADDDDDDDDDDDEEDELAKDDVMQEQVRPQRRGRGRPGKKRASQNEQKPADPVLERLENSKDEAADGAPETDRIEVNVGKKKKRPGRPSKSKAPSPAPVPASLAADTNGVVTVEPDTHTPSTSVACKAADSPSPPEPPASPPTKPISPPAKSTTVAAPTHSPLKNSSAQYRVGLSRKRRIPSLLKIIRPTRPEKR